MKMIETKTRVNNRDCIKFVERKKDTTHWLRIVNDQGCWSYVGKFVKPGYQFVSLEVPGCIDQSVVAHELVHALGFENVRFR